MLRVYHLSRDSRAHIFFLALHSYLRTTLLNFLILSKAIRLNLLLRARIYKLHLLALLILEPIHTLRPSCSSSILLTHPSLQSTNSNTVLPLSTSPLAIISHGKPTSTTANSRLCQAKPNV